MDEGRGDIFPFGLRKKRRIGREGKEEEKKGTGLTTMNVSVGKAQWRKKMKRKREWGEKE